MEGKGIMFVVFSLVCVVLLNLLWSILKWVWLKPKRLERCLRKQGFHGNSYRLLYGDTKDKERMLIEARSKPAMPYLSNDHLSRVLPFFQHTVNTYGKRCFMWNGPTPLVTISEPELMREVFMKINEFQKPQSNHFFKQLATGLVQVEGHVWAKRRKLLNPAFHIDKLKFMLPAFWTSSYHMIQEWEEQASETGSCEIEVWSHLHKLSADVISRAAFGSSYEEGKKIFEFINEQIMVAMPLINSVYIPGLRAHKRMADIDKQIRTLLKGIIDNRKKAMKMGEKSKDDLLGLLLNSSFQDIQNGSKKQNLTKLDLKEVIDECKIFYLAGQETTSTLLVWTLILLGKHQEWQARAREEVRKIFGNEKPDLHQLNHLKTVNKILQEVLRLYPPVSEISRTVKEDIKVGEIFLPKGVLINLPILLVHQDEKYWGPDAKEFKPERFSEGICKASGGNMSFFSFGWGPRICIGSNFAMMEAKLTLALILQRFSFNLSPLYAHAPSALGTLRPQFGAPIIFYRL
ncbi:cytochrome P450 CYP72A219-like isoform X2 [Chenopodium quinoa]|uniref:cytochrome P450 CYP72A219-like isoform X2 n=1 Tax=Chenopodium quinoa TaxID=63459 RepID=UPI000B7987A6|nr:cytochrome P450 CYP72A219-like isoform X2 [Chenopodium quinoa]